MDRRPLAAGRFVVRASEFGAASRCAVAPGEFSTKATNGFVINNLGPQRTFTNRVQSGSGQAARHHG